MKSSPRCFPWRSLRFRANRAMMALLLIVLPLGLSACAPATAPRIHATATLGATEFTTHDHYELYNYDSGFCSFISDTERFAPAGTVLVGADNFFKGDSGPFACIHKLDYAYRGGVRFNLSEFRSFAGIIVEKATLHWRIDSAAVRDASGNPSGVPNGPDVTNCVGALMESKQSIFTQGSFLPAYPYRSGQGDVTDLVQDWVVRGDPNWGFVLVGLNESYSRNNAACVNVISHLTLTLTYSRL